MLARRLLAAAVTLPVAAAVTVIIGQAPASAFEKSSIPASTWAYTNSHDSGKSFLNLKVDTPVGRQEPEGDKKFKARFYFTFDLAKLDGKKVSEANLVLRERSAADCTVPAPLEVWRTAPIGNNPTWNNPPAELEKVGAPTPNAEYECPGYLLLDLLDTVRAAQSRGDTQLTLGLRITEQYEGDRRFGRTFVYHPSLQYSANTAPSVGELRLIAQEPCGTETEPTLVRGSPQLLSAKVADPDQNDHVRAEFAAWPVDQPSQRREFPGVDYGWGTFRYDLAPYPHGTIVAWSARAYDGYDYSEWAPPCYFVVDSAPPAKAPKISSVEYPAGGTASGGPGVPGTFVLDAEGDPDVVGYQLRDPNHQRWEVTAPTPGAAATIVYTPTRYGSHSLYASALDLAGNRGPEVEYGFVVRNSAPQVTVEMNGVNLTSRLILEPGINGTTSYRYRIDDGEEVAVPADTAGKATAELVFTRLGSHKLTVSGYTAAGLAGVWSNTIWITDAPKVGSSGYDGGTHQALVGQPLTWTFSPRAPGVVGYEYRLRWDQEVLRVDANADGVAVFDWTPDEIDYWEITVRSIYANGSTSEWSHESIWVNDLRPYIDAFLYNPWWPAGGVGVADVFSIFEEVPGVTEFILQLNDNPEFTVSTEGSNTVWVELAPDRPGENVLTARARFEDGSLSPARVWTFLVAE